MTRLGRFSGSSFTTDDSGLPVVKIHVPLEMEEQRPSKWGGDEGIGSMIDSGR
jgi:hypothetical protein